LLKQEEWQEDLVVLGRYALSVSMRAPSGRLKEAISRRVKASDMVSDITEIEIREASRKMRDCHWVYEAAKVRQPYVIEIVAKFKAIREGDMAVRVGAIVDALTLRGQQVNGVDERAGIGMLMSELGIDGSSDILENMYPASGYTDDYQDRTQAPEVATPLLVDAIIHAMTLGNRQGQIVGIDEKEGVRLLLKVLQIPNGDQLVERMFPKGEYDPDRSKLDMEPPVPKLAPPAGGVPQIDPLTGQPSAPEPVKESELDAALRQLGHALKVYEASRYHDTNSHA
jgi:hypothetical protein